MKAKALFLLLTGAGLLALTACENELSKVQAIAEKQSYIPVETSTDVSLLYSDSAVMKAKLTTPLLKNFKIKSPYYEMPKGLRVEFYTPDLQIESYLTAKKGWRYINQGIIEVRDSVVVVNKKGEKLETERLIWNEKTQKIYTNRFVKISTKDQVIFGEGFEANQNFTAYKIFKIKGTVSVKQ